MKKALSLILVFVIVLGLAACGGNETPTQENAGLQAGFGRVDISPMTSVGPIGFVTNTYEMFSDHALYVKEKSPFDITFVITGCNGYIANEAAYDYRSYESDTSPYVKGTGEKLAEEMARLLNELK